MIDFLNRWVEMTWEMLIESSFLLMVGLALAGLIWLVMNQSNIGRFIKPNGISGVFRAALVGIPLPLCSCSVLPVATQIRRAGGSKSGTIAFLISTPESGVDSILLTYSLTDPLLTVARPLSAFLAAVAAGVTEVVYPSNGGETVPEVATCSSGCGCNATDPVAVEPKQSWPSKIYSGLKYAFTDLLEDLAPYLLAGFVLAGLVGAIIGPGAEQLPESVKTGWIGYVGALFIGLPMYVCATSSTPLAAVLLAAGFSPGAILVFLLVGPATNIASLVVVRKIIGFWSTLRYLLTIAVVAVISGLIVDKLYKMLDIVPSYRGGAHETHTDIFFVICALILTALIIYYSIPFVWRKLRSFVL